MGTVLPSRRLMLLCRYTCAGWPVPSRFRMTTIPVSAFGPSADTPVGLVAYGTMFTESAP